ncbi:MAG: haloacid dehalogenase-like hydrolase [Vicinamibacterales bacterium]
MTSTRILLFDVDGTLVLTGGAGKRAMDRAFEAEFGVPDAFTGVSMAGRTDRWLVETALERHGLPASSDHLGRFHRRYVVELAASIHEPGVGRRGVLPGVAEALDRVAALDGVQTALLTGNYEHGARIKLQHFGLWTRFSWGAYGDEHAERDALAVAALARARDLGLRLADARHAVVIGDTPFDIACARAAGARVVAVATGGHSLDELRACGPDLALEDLRAVDTLVEFIASD